MLHGDLPTAGRSLARCSNSSGSYRPPSSPPSAAGGASWSKNLLLRQQLQVALRSQHRRHLRTRDKLFWLLSGACTRTGDVTCFWSGRRPCRAGIAGGCLFWRWRSARALGRPRLNSEVRELIATMARENAHWGTVPKRKLQRGGVSLPGCWPGSEPD